jgi:hypothetical protein
LLLLLLITRHGWQVQHNMWLLLQLLPMQAQ